MKLGEKITADQIKDMREDTGMGMMECRKILLRREALDIVNGSWTGLTPGVQAVLRWLVETN